MQHALRAFTPDDAKALKATVDLPAVGLLRLEELLTQLGIGEAAVTILSESGVPTPVVHTRLRAPRSRMARPTTSRARPGLAAVGQVRHAMDAQSAREILAARLQEPAPPPASKSAPKRAAPKAEHKSRARAAGDLGKFLNSRQGKSLQREVVRGVFGLLKKSL